MAPIFVEAGSMFSGKTEELFGSIKRRKIGRQEQGKDFLVFNYYLDDRYGKEVLGCHNGEIAEAISLRNSKELLIFLFNLPEDGYLDELSFEDVKEGLRGLRALYLDEAQFFDKNLARVLVLIDRIFRERDSDRGPLDIHVAGLDMDFRGEPFGGMPELLARAFEVRKHVAVCTYPGCGENTATRTQRLINGEPANYNDPIVLVGGGDSYTARCVDHHEVPGKPRVSLDGLGE